MPLVKAQCTNCNGMLEVDSSKDAAICPHCGTPYIVEKAIQQINNTNYIQNATIINGSKVVGLPAIGKKFGRQKDKKFIDEWLLPIGLWYKEIKRSIDDASISDEDKEYVNSKLQELNARIKPFTDKYKNIAEFSSYMKSIENDYEYKCVIHKKFVKNIETDEYSWVDHDYPDTCFKAENYKGFNPEYGVFLDGYGYPQFCLLRADESTIEGVILDYMNLPEFYEKYKLTPKSKPVPAPSSSGGCYIATCVYGSYDCPQVWTLRRFRDFSLSNSAVGRRFIKCYYATSPTLVKWFGKTKLFQRFWKGVLDRIVRRLNEKGVENTRYYD